MLPDYDHNKLNETITTERKMKVSNEALTSLSDEHMISMGTLCKRLHTSTTRGLTTMQAKQKLKVSRLWQFFSSYPLWNINNNNNNIHKLGIKPVKYGDEHKMLSHRPSHTARPYSSIARHPSFGALPLHPSSIRLSCPNKGKLVSERAMHVYLTSDMTEGNPFNEVTSNF